MSRDWTRDFFRAEIFTPSTPETEAAAPGEVRFIHKVLGLAPGSRVLDVACGTGRHAVRLAKLGADVTGVDSSPAYLARARRAARGLANARFVRADMRRLRFESEFDAAVNLWTSFGYFADPGDDAAALRAIARALKPGGLFLIDVVDASPLLGRGRFRQWTESRDGTFTLEDVAVFGGRDPRIATDWIVVKPGRAPRRARSVVRAYGLARLLAALKKAGFRPLKTWSGLGYGSSGPTGGRLVVLSRRASAGGAASR
jgi:SAM-dependent methyltransferase